VYLLNYGVFKLDYATLDNLFEGRVIHGCCRSRFGRKVWNSTNEIRRGVVYSCVSRSERTGLACNSRTVLEELLKDAVVKAINDLLGQKDDFLEVLSNNIETVINEQDTSTVTEIEKKL
jgi:site-specific DNA recombinase